MYQLQIHCHNTFEEVFEKFVSIERELVAKGLIKIFKENRNNANDGKKFWSRNKNLTNDGVVDVKVVNKIHPTIHLKSPSTSNNQPTSQNQYTNVAQNNQQRRGPPWTNIPKRTYTPLGESIESVLKKLLQSNVIQLLEIRHYELWLFKQNWWNDNDSCEYHLTKGHKISPCWKLMDIIQDFIDQGDISIDNSQGKTNFDHTIFKNTLKYHGFGKASNLGTNIGNQANYTYILYEYTVKKFELLTIISLPLPLRKI